MPEQTFIEKLLSSPTDTLLASFIFLTAVIILYWGIKTDWGLKYKSPNFENGTKKILAETLEKVVQSALSSQTKNLEENHFEHLIERLELAIIKSHEDQNKYLVEQLNKWGSTMHTEITQFLYRLKKKI